MHQPDARAQLKTLVSYQLKIILEQLQYKQDVIIVDTGSAKYGSSAEIFQSPDHDEMWHASKNIISRSGYCTCTIVKGMIYEIRTVFSKVGY